MRLQGQHGYAMAALLVSLSVMAILMTAVMPVWKQTAQREKEAELVFRGLQYVHAIQMFQRRSGPGTYPPSFDFLVEQKFLRKKYKDPITNADFVPVPAISPVTPGSVPGAPGTSSTGAPVGNPNALGTPVSSLPTLGPAGSVPGGIAGVVSKSTDKSIRIYNGQTHYNEWVFRALAQAPTPGGGGPVGPGGQRGGPAPGGPNQPPGAGGIGGPGGQRGAGRGAGRGGFQGGPPRGFPPPGSGPQTITMPPVTIPPPGR
jgi:type II secretory pathway pseudopilin PulG